MIKAPCDGAPFNKIQDTVIIGRFLFPSLYVTFLMVLSPKTEFESKMLQRYSFFFNFIVYDALD